MKQILEIKMVDDTNIDVVKAIKAIRAITKCSLKEAKDIVANVKDGDIEMIETNESVSELELANGVSALRNVGILVSELTKNAEEEIKNKLKEAINIAIDHNSFDIAQILIETISKL